MSEIIHNLAVAITTGLRSTLKPDHKYLVMTRDGLANANRSQYRGYLHYRPNRC